MTMKSLIQPWDLANSLFFLHSPASHRAYFNPAPSGYLYDASNEPGAQLEKLDWEEHNNAKLASALESLDERSQDILQRRWLTDNKATLHDLAAEYGVSAERIRQIEAAAMKKLRTSLSA